MILVSSVIAQLAGLSKRTMLVNDPKFGKVNRTFFLGAPANRTGPLLLGLHGQGHTADDWAGEHSFDKIAHTTGWVTLYPQGMADGGSGDFDSGWNVGTNADNSTCLLGTTGGGCHDSCSVRGMCGRCAW